MTTNARNDGSAGGDPDRDHMTIVSVWQVHSPDMELVSQRPHWLVWNRRGG